MKYVITLITCILLAGCTSSNKEYNSDFSVYLKPGEELIYCASPYNIPEKLLYYKSGQIRNDIEVPGAAEPFSSYYITDVLDNVYSINSDEMQNYTCSKVKKR